MKLESRGMEFVPPKSGQARVVESTDGSVEALRAHRSRSAAEGEFVFCQPDGSPLRPDRVTNAFRGLVRGAGVPKLRFHDLRHTHASLMLSQGIHLKVVFRETGPQHDRDNRGSLLSCPADGAA